MSSEPILLVDDELSILQLTRLYLEREGFRVHGAKDGEATLEAVNRLRGGSTRWHKRFAPVECSLAQAEFS